MTAHVWRFLRAGGFDQVRIETGEDILSLDELDMKLWVALACPVAGMEFDAKTLEILDLDHDGRIRASEIIETVRWLRRVLKDPEILTGEGETLPLSVISEETAEGRRLLASARRILVSRGKEGADTVTVEDATDTEHVFDQTDFNGDGVIPASAAADPQTAAVIEDLITVYGPVADRSGKPGIDQDRADRFAGEISSFRSWWEASQADPAILPLGADTYDAFLALRAVEIKIADYFERCRLSAFSAQAAEAANPDEDFFAVMAQRPLEESQDQLRGLALAEIAPGRPLPLSERLNPTWRAEMDSFRDRVAKPILGDVAELDEAAWNRVFHAFAAHRAWRAGKPNNAIDVLGEARLVELAAHPHKEELDRLIAKDKALEDEASAIDDVLRLTLLRRYFLSLLNNFVSFREFYTKRSKATFQAGTLYLDGRSCDLCVKVGDVAKHAAMATLSQIYLAYCECSRPLTGEKMCIAAAFTAGDSDRLMVGRNGLFYDRQGRDWDAVVVRIIEHPISMRQAFLAPYKQFGRFIGEQVEKLAQAKSKMVHDDFSQAISSTATNAMKPPASGPIPVAPARPGAQGAAAAPQPAATPFDIGRFAGVFAAIGLAIGAIGTALAHVAGTFLGLRWWQMPLAVLGLVLVISGPSMVIAYVKLRQRNLAPLLDANGWAINARAKINIPFGGSLTHLAKLPPGAERSLNDPFAEKQVPWRLYLALLIMIGAAAAAVYLTGGIEKLFHRLMDLL
jgi:hypothetical protein